MLLHHSRRITDRFKSNSATLTAPTELHRKTRHAYAHIVDVALEILRTEFLPFLLIALGASTGWTVIPHILLYAVYTRESGNSTVERCLSAMAMLVRTPGFTAVAVIVNSFLRRGELQLNLLFPELTDIFSELDDLIAHVCLSFNPYGYRLTVTHRCDAVGSKLEEYDLIEDGIFPARYPVFITITGLLTLNPAYGYVVLPLCIFGMGWERKIDPLLTLDSDSELMVFEATNSTFGDRSFGPIFRADGTLYARGKHLVPLTHRSTPYRPHYLEHEDMTIWGHPVASVPGVIKLTLPKVEATPEIQGHFDGRQSQRATHYSCSFWNNWYQPTPPSSDGSFSFLHFTIPRRLSKPRPLAEIRFHRHKVKEKVIGEGNPTNPITTPCGEQIDDGNMTTEHTIEKCKRSEGGDTTTRASGLPLRHRG